MVCSGRNETSFVLTYVDTDELDTLFHILVTSIQQVKSNEAFIMLGRDYRQRVLAYVWVEVFVLHAACCPVNLIHMSRR